MRKLIATLAILFCIFRLMPFDTTAFTPATVLGASVCVVLLTAAFYQAFTILNL